MDDAKLEEAKKALDLMTCQGMGAAYDQALMDAAIHGTGYIMLTGDETGIEANSLDPSDVTLEVPETSTDETGR